MLYLVLILSNNVKVQKSFTLNANLQILEVITIMLKVLSLIAKRTKVDFG